MQIALNTLVLQSYKATEAVEAARFLGAIEINGRHLPPNTPPDQARELLQGLAVVNIGAYTGGFTSGDHQSILAELAKYVDLAQAIGAPAIRVYPGGPSLGDIDPNLYKRAVIGLKEAAHIANPLKLYFELHHGDLADSADNAMRLIDDIGADNLGVILDPANLFIGNADYLDKAVKTLGTRLSLVHMKDLKKLPSSAPKAFLIEGTYYSHQLLGDGDLKLEKLISVLKENEYTGYLSLEYHGDDATPQIVRREAEWLSKRL